MRNSNGWSLYSNSWYFWGFVYTEVFGAVNSSGILILSLSTWRIRNIKEIGARAFLCIAGRSSRRSNLAGMYVENFRTYFAVSMPYPDKLYTASFVSLSPEIQSQLGGLFMFEQLLCMNMSMNCWKYGCWKVDDSFAQSQTLAESLTRRA